MEIGYPTDVKHVAHIGWDGPSGSAPSWMNEYKSTHDFSSSSLGSFIEPRDTNNIVACSTWSSQDFEQSMGQHPVSEMFKDCPPTDVPNIPKKHKRKKTKSTSSPKSSSSSVSRSSRALKSKATYMELETTSNLQLQNQCTLNNLLQRTKETPIVHIKGRQSPPFCSWGVQSTGASRKKHRRCVNLAVKAYCISEIHIVTKGKTRRLGNRDVEACKKC